MTEKSELLIALGSCHADVLDEETSMQGFLNCIRDAPQAARSLCEYWRLRVELFGDNAYRPLQLLPTPKTAPPTTTGTTVESALTLDDMAAVESSEFQLLPSDKADKPVLYLQRSSHLPNISAPCRLRAVFFLFNKALSSALKRSSCPSLVKVVLLVNALEESSPLDADFALGLDRLLTLFPMAIAKVDILAIGPSPVQQDRVISLLKDKYDDRLTVYCPDSVSLLKKLKAAGYSKRGLPCELGGTLSADYHEGWLKRTSRYEAQVYLTEDQRRERKQKMNAVHSRRKRQRRLHELESLQNQQAELEESIAHARGTNQLLESLLEAAHAMVAEEDNRQARRQAVAMLPSSFLSGDQLGETTEKTDRTYNMPYYPLQNGHTDRLGQSYSQPDATHAWPLNILQVPMNAPLVIPTPTPGAPWALQQVAHSVAHSFAPTRANSQGWEAVPPLQAYGNPSHSTGAPVGFASSLDPTPLPTVFDMRSPTSLSNQNQEARAGDQLWRLWGEAQRQAGESKQLEPDYPAENQSREHLPWFGWNP